MCQLCALVVRVAVSLCQLRLQRCLQRTCVAAAGLQLLARLPQLARARLCVCACCTQLLPQLLQLCLLSAYQPLQLMQPLMLRNLLPLLFPLLLLLLQLLHLVLLVPLMYAVRSHAIRSLRCTTSIARSPPCLHAHVLLPHHRRPLLLQQRHCARDRCSSLCMRNNCTMQNCTS